MMAGFPKATNIDCITCDYCRKFRNKKTRAMKYTCWKEDAEVLGVFADSKPCGLPKGENYKATYEITKVKQI